MEIIWFASGIYGFLGAVLLVVFHVLPQLKTLRGKRRFPFFEGKNEKEIEFAIKNYSFYSQLWSFRLICTSFLIIILFSLSYFEYSDSLGNILYVLVDSIILFFVASYGVVSVSKTGVEIRWPHLIAFYIFPFAVIFYFIFFIFDDMTISYIFLIASIVSQSLFAAMWYIKFHPDLQSRVSNNSKNSNHK